jgi:hypothetical protein
MGQFTLTKGTPNRNWESNMLFMALFFFEKSNWSVCAQVLPALARSGAGSQSNYQAPGLSV